ncbi:single-stranded-DNA-specific exonuclease RecJ [Pontibacillus yanchengensis]|uniref:Single-stranded-DNA-specific exonuclease RecJ n=1 Tax=Pontibacillus yanchengensis TaxID=462910 RepID=A0ACC7VF48_9BACI|nr:single-stranded-DNA-specific exonuclease RecJ [Pontibacillus yanchengensis]MYL53397.1 single-stranded-DNA-specific exonuclease RecJ [Pontibacillus yanchengensis]
MLRSKAKWNFVQGEEHSLPIDDSLSSLTQQLLRQRGIHTKEAAEQFLSPQLQQLHDPMLMNDMDKAVERVKDAISKGERILVFGDYDADGVSSTAVMMETLRELGAEVAYYIPNRFTEGYGPNEEAFRNAKEEDVALIITVDTGIAAHHEAKVAKELGIDLIITDHHEVQESLPEAYAIVHPKCSSSYPFQELAGVGVAFKFAHALLGDFPKHLLDLVVIGTIADLVPLHDENRVLSYYGLQALSRSVRPGFQALRQLCGIEGPLTEEDIGFAIGPRINAVGRLQNASPAVELLLTEDDDEAAYLANQIQELNQERQQIVADIAKEAETMLDAEGDDLPSVIVVAKEGWNQGVLGIVASRLVRRFDRPVIVLTIDPETETAKGSARSIDAFDLFTNCMQIRDLFTHFGGHAQAAGMTLPVENVDTVRAALSQQANEQLHPDDFREVLSIDGTLDLSQVSLDTIDEINQLAPFGMGNPKPLFCIDRSAPAEIRQIGSNLNHLKMKFKDDKNELDAIGFGLGELYTKLAPQSAMTTVGELSINEWNGRKKPQFMMKDIRVDEWQLFDLRGSRHLKKAVTTVPQDNAVAVFFHPVTAEHEWVWEYFDVLQIEDEEMVEELPLDEVDHLILMDLPQSLDRLATLVQNMNPKNIHACYRTDDAAFLKTVPTRDHFKWFYAMLLKRKQLHLEKEGPKLAAHKGWSKDAVEFISNVFFELEFVKIENGLVTLNSNPSKKDLSESALYQSKHEYVNVEQTLYFSSYRQLKSWFDEQMNRVVQAKEEVTNEP